MDINVAPDNQEPALFKVIVARLDQQFISSYQANTIQDQEEIAAFVASISSFIIRENLATQANYNRTYNR
jgi:hypothetical protein